MIKPMPAPKEYPKGSAQFDPQWYLMHHTQVDGEGAYIGPFPDGAAAEDYRAVHDLSLYAVVRTSKPRPATSPKEY